jgi:hypothetical protein
MCHTTIVIMIHSPQHTCHIFNFFYFYHAQWVLNTAQLKTLLSVSFV